MCPGPVSLLAVAVVATAAALAAQDTHGTTIIEGTEVAWDITDSKGNEYRWSMPVTTYEDNIVESRFLVRDKVNLDLDGETRHVVSLDGFVRESFSKVIDNVYDNSRSNSDFVWEVWYIVSQLTVYDKDIHEYSEGRYALETLTRGGGDCEDLTILIADMLMSSRHTDDWEFKYVYMDSENPRDPQAINHAILFVDDGKYKYFIEATGPPDWDYFPDGVVGWYFDVVPHTNELDFAGQDLSGLDLEHKDFAWADLSFADLSGTDLSFADLRGADLTGANLNNADLYGAYLEDASLLGASLLDTDLRRAYLGGADLSFADLRGANLRHSDLGGADLTGAHLQDADLFMTYLSGAYLLEAYMADANLRGAYLWGADLAFAYMYGANLYGADLGEADLTGAVLDGADLGRINWYGVIGWPPE